MMSKVYSFFLIKNSSLLFFSILCVVELAPHQILWPDFQDQEIPSQKWNLNCPIPNGFESKLVIKSGTTPREDVGEEPIRVHKKSHMSGSTYICSLSGSLASYSEKNHYYPNSWMCFIGELIFISVLVFLH